MTDVRSSDERADEIFEAWLSQLEAGEQEAQSVVLARHADLADRLRARFDAMGLMDRALSAPEAAGPPERLGGFRIVREIARGGMGVVYEAEQEDMGRRVALKVLYPSMFPTSRAVERFQQEARAAGRLKHTNIVAVHQLGTERGLWYCAQELVDGPPLSDVIENMRELGQGVPDSTDGTVGSHPSALTGVPSGSGAYWTRIAAMFAEVADALQTAHDHDVVHRDVKPGNLLLDPEGHLRLVDFGLARLADQANAMTRTGDLVGTPLYMSPEQFRGQPDGIDGRTDVYSLGATLYETLTLQPPFPGREPARLAARILNEEPPSPRSLDRRIPRDLQTIVVKTLEKEPARRYASAGALAADLNAFANGHPIQARRIGPLPRLWRQVKRHKVRSALVAALLIAVLVGVKLGGDARHEALSRRATAYDQLVRRAHVSVTRYTSPLLTQSGAGIVGAPAPTGGTGLPGGGTAEELFAEAIALDPARHEAWFGRALVAGREPAARLADIDAAAERGLSPRVRHLARAHVLLAQGRTSEAAAEAEVGQALPAGGPREAFFEGELLVRQGRREEGLAKLSRAVAGTLQGDPIHVLALLTRARVHEAESRWVEALLDLAAARDAAPGDAAVPIRMARALSELGRVVEAERTLDEALVRAQESYSERDWLLMWSTCHLLQRPAWRARVSTEAYRRFPDSTLMLAWRGVQLGREGRAKESFTLLDRALTRAPPGSSLRDEVLECRATAHFALRQWAEAEALYRELLDRHATRVELRGSLAACLLNQQRFEEAIPLIEALYRLDPHESTVNYQMAWLWQLRGDLDQAFRFAERSIELEPFSSLGHSMIAKLWQIRGDYEQALEAMNAALAVEPERAFLLESKARILNNLGRYHEVLAICEALRRREGAVPGEPYVRGFALGGLGRYAEAVDALEKACKTGTDGFLAWLDLCFALNALGRSEEALARLQGWPGEVADLSPRDRLYRGEMLNRLGRHADALADVRAAVAADGENRRALYALARALQGTGDFAGAMPVYENAAALGMDAPDFHLNRARCLMAVRRTDEAVAVVEAVLARDDANVSALVLHAGLLHGTPRLADALGSARRAMSLAPQAPMVANVYALCLSRAGELDAALEVLEEVPAAERDDASVLALLGQILVRLGRYEAGLRFLDRALSNPALEAMSGEAHKYRADALVRLGRFEEARQAAERAIEVMNPPWAGPHAARADALVRLGEVDAAIAAYELVLEMEGDSALSKAVWIELVRLLRDEKRDFEAAAATARHAHLLHPADAALTHLHAYSELLRGDVPASAQAYAELLDAPGVTALHRAEGACIIAASGDATGALSRLRTGPEGGIWDAVVGAYLLRVLDREEEATAVAVARVAAVREVGPPFAVGYLGAVAGRPDEARTALAREHPQEFGRILLPRADAYALLGMPDESETCIVRALRLVWQGDDRCFLPPTPAILSSDDRPAVVLLQDAYRTQTAGRRLDLPALLTARLAEHPDDEAWRALQAALTR